MASIRDVAIKAGVGIGTVSNLAEHALVAIGVQIILDMFNQRCHKRM